MNKLLLLCIVPFVFGCRYSYIEERDGEKIRIEGRAVGKWKLSRTESEILTTKEEMEKVKLDAKRTKSEAMSALIPRGGWMLTVGLVMGAAGIAIGLVATAKLYQAVAGGVAIGGGVLSAAGLLLMGIGLVVAYVAIVLCIVMGILSIVYFRNHKFIKG